MSVEKLVWCLLYAGQEKKKKKARRLSQKTHSVLSFLEAHILKVFKHPLCAGHCACRSHKYEKRISGLLEHTIRLQNKVSRGSRKKAHTQDSISYFQDSPQAHAPRRIGRPGKNQVPGAEDASS